MIRRDFAKLGLTSLGLLAAGQSSAFADMPFSVVHEPALAIAHPESVVLLAITRAGGRLVAAGQHGVIIYSDDHGQSWRQASVPVNIVITNLYFVTPQIGWATADYGIILRTADAGMTWQVQLQGDEVLKLMTAAAQQFAAANPGTPAAALAVRRAGIFAGGGPDKPFLCIAGVSPEVVFVYGAYRMTVLTKDGGKNWVDYSLHVPDPISHNIYDATWIGSSLFLAGEAGSLFRSDDQGTTYAMLKSPTETTLLGVISTGGDAILTYGVAGTAYRSVDGGNSWTQVTVPTNSDLTAAVTLKSGRVIVLAENGVILASQDQGATLRPVPLIENMLLFDVVQADNQDVVFVGSGGVKVIPESMLQG